MRLESSFEEKKLANSFLQSFSHMVSLLNKYRGLIMMTEKQQV